MSQADVDLRDEHCFIRKEIVRDFLVDVYELHLETYTIFSY